MAQQNDGLAERGEGEIHKGERSDDEPVEKDEKLDGGLRRSD